MIEPVRCLVRLAAGPRDRRGVRPARPARARLREAMNLAFVLLSKPSVPGPDDVVREFTRFAAQGESLRWGAVPAAEGKEPGIEVLQFDAGEWGAGFVAAMPLPVPNREADDG